MPGFRRLFGNYTLKERWHGIPRISKGLANSSYGVKFLTLERLKTFPRNKMYILERVVPQLLDLALNDSNPEISSRAVEILNIIKGKKVFGHLEEIALNAESERAKETARKLLEKLQD